MDNKINEQILEELIMIRKLLTILSQDKLADFNEQIKNRYLTTEQRKKMYDLFDGTKSLKEIGEEVNTSSEAVRLFAVSLEKAGLIEYVSNTKAKCPKRLF
ncbi:hypothetical protein DXB43_13375 [Roseburia sp. OM04-10BH]|jgi:hypothetical protein|uniref:hypothetical protein n=1 Tax=Lachnospiraceae TaxID=186803 RepID=UPI000E5064F2|nr:MULTISPECIES: hypothetical protein [unclassified Roseburia]RGI41830.1 hypothetical protein DXB43_13375 [Roseburia sp. OM04-10BH]RHV37688.1 hypothetical protein DXB49_13120 [Roseburia sp. OM04-15AA]RHV54487.1 hypothetical protein DXB42_14965 [Roseburia sp. OM04-10AA]